MGGLSKGVIGSRSRLMYLVLITLVVLPQPGISFGIDCRGRYKSGRSMLCNTPV